MRPQPRRAASIAATSIFFICIIASNARSATAGSGSVITFVRAIGVICQDNPHLSLHHPHALSWPPLPMIASQWRSVSAWSAVATWNENALVPPRQREPEHAGVEGEVRLERP